MKSTGSTGSTRAGVIASDDLRIAVGAVTRQRRTRGAAHVLGIGRDTLSRVVDGEAVRPGTIALIRERLAALAAAGEAA